MYETETQVFGNVVAHGVDHVDLADFSRLLIVPFENSLEIYFTSAELAAAGGGSNRLEKLASRFAVKEAVLKALGTGWGDGVAFTDVEVINSPKGAPSIFLYRNLEKIAAELGVVKWLVSSSHSGVLAFASVIALRSS
ncbi:holo-ACP synthase [Pseudomonas aeruginosa]|uniref:holo-ACP synthase n=1 Tax=Pseudomonas aeruginosa TaxID=287 RepID=UPI002E1B7C7E|nr:holo-ACP synthase [Pseudomonas aeruginosa]MED5024798.1 holo-ACP synthase [Pseudomonas aeruginosa]